MLARIKLPLPDIRKALQDVDDSQLSIDDLKAISRQLPTAEEVTYHISTSSSGTRVFNSGTFADRAHTRLRASD